MYVYNKISTICAITITWDFGFWPISGFYDNFIILLVMSDDMTVNVAYSSKVFKYVINKIIIYLMV